MNADTFIHRFRIVARAPNGISRLRELILELAVTGRLVSGPDGAKHEDPAKPVHDTQPLDLEYPPVESVAVLPKIPGHWQWKRLGNLALSHDSGWSPQCKGIPRTGTDWGVLKVSAVTWGRFLPEENKALQAHMEPRPEYEVRDGDFLLSRANTAELVAKSVVVESPPPHLMMSDKIVRFRFPPSVAARYVNIFNLSRFARAYYAENASGTSASMKNVGRKTMCMLPVAIPPLGEQQRIVAKVDELMRLCDRLESQLAERAKLIPLLSRANHDRFVQEPTEENLKAIFHEAGSIVADDIWRTVCTLGVTGHLADKANDELDGAQLLELAGIDFVYPVDAPKLPGHWRWATLGSAAIAMDSGWSPACPQKPATADQWGVLKTTAVQSMTYLEEQNKVLPNSLDPRPEAEVQDGDILLTRAGPKNRVGIICVAKPTRPKLMISDKIIRIHLFAGMVPEFAALVLNSGYSSSCLESLKTGMAASQMNISQQKLRTVPIPVPPTGEQIRILKRVDQMLQLIRELTAFYGQRETIATDFANAVVRAITQNETVETEKMEPPKTEVVTSLRRAKKPPKNANAPLSEMLAAEDLSAKVLWQRSGLEIDRFYAQLKTEIANGWIAEPEPATVKEVEVD